MDAALGPGAGRGLLTLPHTTPAEVPDAVRGAFAGLLRRAGPNPGSRLEEMAATSAGELLEAARLGLVCERLEIAGAGRTGRGGGLGAGGPAHRGPGR